MSYDDFLDMYEEDLWIEYHELGMNYELDSSFESFTEERYEQYLKLTEK